MAQIGKTATRDARSARPGAAQMTQFLESLTESSNVAASARGGGGSGRLTIDAPGAAERVRVSYRAGIADDGAGVPDAIRQGIVRMTQHLYDARDGKDPAPPAVIAALWQPWRVLSLGGGR